MSLGLVLGGGGVAGVGWEAGVIAGLAEAGVQLSGASGARRIVGTSAGAIVGAALGSGPEGGAGLERLLVAGRSAAPLPDAAAGAASADASGREGPGSRSERMRRIGAEALRARTVDVERYRAFIADLLPHRRWPQGVDLRVTAVDAEAGTVRVFGAESGVGMVDAVAASCAVPGRFPVVTIGDGRYFDGGTASPTHADLAADCSEVLVIAPCAAPGAGSGLDEEVAELGGGVRSAVIVPDAASRALFGTDPLESPARLSAAETGRAQGRSEAMRIGIMLSL